jgi:hypothetical protein
MAYAYNPSTQEAEPGGSQVLGQPGQHSNKKTEIRFGVIPNKVMI